MFLYGLASGDTVLGLPFTLGFTLSACGVRL